MEYLHTMVRVQDLEASLHFYCELLGLKEVRRTVAKGESFAAPRAMGISGKLRQLVVA